MSARYTQEPPRERGFWDLLPRRNFRRVLLLLLALVAVVVIKRSGGGSLHNLLEVMAPPPPKVAAPTPSTEAGPTFQRLHVQGAHP
jgi:hypothetical protein